MKLMIASDIHGSAYFCDKMLKAFDKEKADKLLLLGDILYHGPRNELPRDYAPKEVAAMLNLRKADILCVRGNCDTEVDQMVLDFPIMAEYCILYVADRMLFATHGHKFNEKSLPPLGKGDVLLNGHTHIPKCCEYDEYVYVNSGSVSIPKNGSAYSYMTLTDGLFEWKELDGSIYQSYRL